MIAIDVHAVCSGWKGIIAKHTNPYCIPKSTRDILDAAESLYPIEQLDNSDFLMAKQDILEWAVELGCRGLITPNEYKEIAKDIARS